MGLVVFFYTLRVKKNVHCGFPTFFVQTCFRIDKHTHKHTFIYLCLRKSTALYTVNLLLCILVNTFYRVTPLGHLSGFSINSLLYDLK